MIPSDHWAELGIPATDDPAAIRRAYAAALKTFDADAEPERFGRLRHAYEAALRGNDASLPLLETFDDLQAESQAANSEPPPYDMRPFEQIKTILFTDRQPYPLDRATLEQATRQLLADPAMDHIDHLQFVDAWLAEAIAHGDERADGMIEPAFAHFAWEQRRGDWNDHPVFEHLVQRRRGVAMIERLADPGSHFHRTYLELTAQPGLRLAAARGDVADLINMIRSEAPYAETRLNRKRVDEYIAYVNGEPLPAAPVSAEENRSEWLVPAIISVALLVLLSVVINLADKYGYWPR